jgi:hypothetical protein
MLTAKLANENTLLWLSRGFAVLLLPLALLAIMDLIGGFFTASYPLNITGSGLSNILIMVTVIAGEVAGLTIRRHHSLRRKIIHLAITTGALVWVGSKMLILALS